MPIIFGSLDFQLEIPTDEKFLGDKNMPVYLLNTKIRSTMRCLSDFELYPRWVPLTHTKQGHFEEC